jgi:hypothetical protein
MASDEPHGHSSEPPAEPAPDALGRLEQRLDRASEAAEQLLADAARRMAGQAPPVGEPPPAGKPPPAGWQRSAAESADSRDGASPLGGEAELLLGILASLRDRLPPDLQQRLAEALREVLLALRALIDWYLERSEHERSEPVRVRDIPIL